MCLKDYIFQNKINNKNKTAICNPVENLKILLCYAWLVLVTLDITAI